jgi:hypothetical protein
VSYCQKRRYRTSVDAMLALINIQDHRDIDNLDKHERSWYDCDKCGGFHLTSWRTETG